ncbi:MAG: ATPase, T2SS/T4P/T4SS family, partial [Gammaproteobacteria bacterium]
MAVSSNRVPLSGLARKLVADGILAEDAAGEAFQGALTKKIPFVRFLVENNLADPRAIAHAASSEFGVPMIDIDALEIDNDTIKLVSRDLIQKHGALPLYKRGTRVFIGVADPTNLQALDEIKFNIGGGTTEAVVVEWNKLAKVIDKALEDTDTSLGDMGGGDLEDFDDVEVGSTEQEQHDDSDIDDAPVVRFVNKCLIDAIKRGASDLHFEPYEKIYRVRFRIDGVLQEVSRPPLALAGKIAARIKVMSRLDVSERRVPQDGRIKLKLSKNKAIDFRVSTCPTLFGEKSVLRILDSDSAKLQIDQLGYEDFQKELFLKNLVKPYGMFL